MVLEKIDTYAEFKSSYTKMFQRVSEQYAELLEKLTDAIQRQVKDNKTQ